MGSVTSLIKSSGDGRHAHCAISFIHTHTVPPFAAQLESQLWQAAKGAVGRSRAKSGTEGEYSAPIRKQQLVWQPVLPFWPPSPLKPAHSRRGTAAWRMCCA